ncbi:MAG: hypothetical protein F6K09_07230 [Merismopedia sp. SIO2A8]|nr:hypothetical protein [Merismopedia sp. SIO2A8]
MSEYDVDVDGPDHESVPPQNVKTLLLGINIRGIVETIGPPAIDRVPL